MAISTGDRLPGGTLYRLGEEGVETVELSDILGHRKVALFAVPGAFTPTCSEQHVPSFVRNADALRTKGIDEIICLSVNDPFVLNAWQESMGAKEASVSILADPSGEFTKSIGMDFDAPPAGLHNRSVRYSMLVEDGIIRSLNQEESPGVCGITSGDTLLSQISA